MNRTLQIMKGTNQYKNKTEMKRSREINKFESNLFEIDSVVAENESFLPIENLAYIDERGDKGRISVIFNIPLMCHRRTIDAELTKVFRNEEISRNSKILVPNFLKSSRQ